MHFQMYKCIYFAIHLAQFCGQRWGLNKTFKTKLKSQQQQQKHCENVNTKYKYAKHYYRKLNTKKKKNTEQIYHSARSHRVK